MLPTLSATPNPITVMALGISHSGTTTIDWATADAAIFGQVTYTVNAGPELAFDGGLGEKKTSGSKLTPRLAYGNDYVFYLRDAGSNKLLRQISVTIVEELGLPPSLIGALLDRVPQAIKDVSVHPGVDTVQIGFTTARATIPAVTITDSAGQTVGSAIGPLSPRVKFGFNLAAGSGLFGPLDQDAVFDFHITAPAPAGSHWPDATFSGQFRSGSRTATVFFDSFNGDMGDDTDYVKLDFCVGDAETSMALAPEQWWGRKSWVTEYKYVTYATNISFPVTHAPQLLETQVYASAWDDGFLGLDPDYLPAYSPHFGTAGTVVSTNGESSTTLVTTDFDLSGAGEPPQTTPFVIKPTPGGPVDFTVNGRLQMEASNGVLISPDVITPAPPIRPVQWIATLSERLSEVSLGDGDGRIKLRLAGRTLYSAAPRFEAVASGLDGPIVAAVAGGRLHIFQSGNDKQVLHQVHVPGGAAGGQWQSLGGKFVSTIAATVVRERVELFGLSPDGRILHRGLDGGDWTVFGEGIAGSLSAFASPKGEIVVIGVSREGHILVRTLHSNEWRSLGQSPGGELGASFAGDVVVLASVADGTVSAAAWRGFPEIDPHLHWKVVGTPASLFEANFSLMGAPGGKGTETAG
jgi:hypothetical protein